MMKFSEENVVQTEEGDTLSIGVGMKGCECCRDTFLVSMFGNNPRTYHQGRFTKDELKKLGDMIARLTND
jgi:hypothetical protein